MLELKNISCGYGVFNAASDLSLKLEAGTITALLGANGAGKSSTLMCIAGHVELQAAGLVGVVAGLELLFEGGAVGGREALKGAHVSPLF